MIAKRIKIALFIASIVFILWMTIFSRKAIYHYNVEMRPLWGFQEMIAGNPHWKMYAMYWVENVLLFMPFGVLFPSTNKFIVSGIGIVFSITIETIQFFACLGLCELDDIICNGLGALLGFMMFNYGQSLVRRAKEIHRTKSTRATRINH